MNVVVGAEGGRGKGRVKRGEGGGGGSRAKVGLHARATVKHPVGQTCGWGPNC
jgi:hypothetical protein